MKTSNYTKDTINIEFKQKNKKGEFIVTHTCIDKPYKKHILSEAQVNLMIAEMEKNNWVCNDVVTKFIGVVGYAGAGKDTFANMCIEILTPQKAIRMAFADNVKIEAAKFLSPIMKKPVKEILAEMHDPVKKLRYRLILQWWGTELRRFDDEDYWVDKIKGDISAAEMKEFIFFTDVRFQNEVDYIKDNGGMIIWVDNGKRSKDTHSSEQLDFKQRDIQVCNVSTLDNLNKLATEVCLELLQKYNKRN